jgi:hypothetical protein
LGGQKFLSDPKCTIKFWKQGTFTYGDPKLLDRWKALDNQANAAIPP